MLSLIVFLPLVGAIVALLAGGRGDRPEREPLVRNIALATSLLTFAATLVLWWRFDPTSADYQFVETHAWMPMFGIQYLIGVDGISLFLLVLTGFLTPAGAALLVGLGAQEREAVFVLRARARDGDARRLRFDRSLSLLHLLGRDAHPDVLPDRDLGIRAAHLRGDQVHPLHHGRQRADAHRDHRPRLGARGGQRHRDAELQPARPLRPGALGPDGELVLPGVRRRLCYQSAALSVPHLAAGRARRGAHGWVGHPCRRAAEDGHLRLAALCVSALSGRSPGDGPDHRVACRDRHHLWRSGGHGAARHEEAGGVLERQPPRFRRPRALRDEPAGCPGFALPDAEPRRQHRRAVHDRRHALGPAAHEAHLRVRRSQIGHASARRRLPHRDAVVDRATGVEWVRRRIPDPRRRVPLESDPRRAGRDRRHPLGRLYAVDVPARELWAGDQREKPHLA